MNEREMTLAAIFNVFTSWSLVDHFEEGTLGELKSKTEQAANSGEYTVRQAYEILSDALERYPELSDTKILGPSWMQGGRFNSETVACAFELPSGEIFVSYCGTGDGGWIDNGQGVTQASTQQQRQALTGIGCRIGQGFLYARPMPAADYEALLGAGTPLPASA